MQIDWQYVKLILSLQSELNAKEMEISKIEEIIKKEIEFCESIDCEKNEYGQFIYDSRNKKSAINLAYILMEYKDFLIEKGIVKDVSCVIHN